MVIYLLGIISNNIPKGLYISYTLNLLNMAKIKLEGYLCERCGHKWIPREQTEEPRVCPKCKSPYWNRPRKEKK